MQSKTGQNYTQQETKQKGQIDFKFNFTATVFFF